MQMLKLEKADNNAENYKLMVDSIEELVKDEKDLIANLSNISAIINLYMDNINWVGFYIMRGGELVLGPFQGKPACIRIKLGKGVCGTAASKKETILVHDVHEFEGHIACDSASNSEIVVPILKNGKVVGVLDIDSPVVGRFTQVEQELFERIVRLIEGII